MACGLQRHVLDGIESGRRTMPASSTCCAIAEALGCSLDWLIAGKGEGPTEAALRDAVRLALERAKDREKARRAAPPAETDAGRAA